MKFLYVFLMLVCLSAQAQFDPAIIVGTNEPFVDKVLAADLNGDSILDLVVQQNLFPNDGIVFYPGQGNGNFNTKVNITSATDSLGTIEDFAVKDINGDGRVDIAVVIHHFKKWTIWYENTSAGFMMHVLDSNNFFSTKVSINDLNNDSLEDIVVLDHTDVKIYLQNQNGSFTKIDAIITNSEQYSLAVFDANGDGLNDIGITSGGFSVYLNQGDNSTYTLNDSEGIVISFGLWAHDFDLDGDQDLFINSSSMGFQSYTNDGSGDFTLKETIRTSDNVRSMGLVDIDFDNDLDLITTQGQLRQVVYYLNENDTFSTQSIIIHQLTNELVYEICVGDFNKDNLLDVAWGGGNTIGVNLLQNLLSMHQLTSRTNKLNIYPNPSNGSITIHNPNNEPITIEIYNIQGARLKQSSLSSKEYFSYTFRRSGIYFADIMDSNKKHEKKQMIIVK